MTEIDFVQASVSFINLAYSAGQWWIAVTTALLVATYVAGRHIPPWLLGFVVVLYLLAAISAIFEIWNYSALATDYARRLADYRSAHHVAFAEAEPATQLDYVNAYLLEATLIIGTFCAAAFTVIHWRKVRNLGSPG